MTEAEENFANDFASFKGKRINSDNNEFNNFKGLQPFPMRKDEPPSFAQRVQEERKKSVTDGNF